MHIRSTSQITPLSPPSIITPVIVTNKCERTQFAPTLSAMLPILDSTYYGRVFLVLIVLVSLEICMRTFVTNGISQAFNFALQEQQSRNNLNSEAGGDEFLNVTSSVTPDRRSWSGVTSAPAKNISVKTSFEEVKRRLDQRNQILRGNCSLIKELKTRVLRAIDILRNYYIEEYNLFLCISAKVITSKII